MNTVHARRTNVTCCDARIESISILMSQAMRSANQISITMCFMVDEKPIKAVCCFPYLWQASNKSYKDARAKENTWKEVASQVIEQTANKNILLSFYFELYYHDFLELLSKYRTHLHFFVSVTFFIICKAKQAAMLQSP